MRSARAHGYLGDAAEVRRSTDEAFASLARSDAADDPLYVHWVDATEVSAKAGDGLIRAKQPALARPYLDAAIASYPDSRPRSRAVYINSLAQSFLMEGELEQACSSAVDAADMAEELTSRRLVGYAHEFAGKLEPSKGNAAADAFRDRAKALQARVPATTV